MRAAWRWFGPNDPVTLADIRQVGADEIVIALHDMPAGEAWTAADVAARKALIETTPPGLKPLTWTVVESIPVHDDIKRAAPGHERHIDAWIASLEALAANDIRIVCYNFMPVLDWTRSDLGWTLPTGARALRFDADAVAAFDLFILTRKDADRDWDSAARARAADKHASMSDVERGRLTANIIAGLPGGMTGRHTLQSFKAALTTYRGINRAALRANLIRFLERVVPVAEALGIKLAIHPDDPPRDLFGLPRCNSTESDFDALFAAVPSPANGITFCVGSLGVRPDNDVPAMAARFANRIYFAHLRDTARDSFNPQSFYEAEHLRGSTNMVAVVDALRREEVRRASEGGEAIPFRPDHGHQMLDDLAKTVNPGYSAIGRMKGLAEIRGIEAALDYAAGRASATTTFGS
jgi:mannonate dehydratase